MTGQHLLSWSVIAVASGAPFKLGRELMQPCAAPSSPLKKVSATCLSHMLSRPNQNPSSKVLQCHDEAQGTVHSHARHMQWR